MTHRYISNLIIIGSDNGLSPGQCQAIIWTNAGILLIRTWGTNFSEILSEIYTYFIQENAFENVVCEMSVILSRPQVLSKPSRRRWLETPSHSLWRHCNERNWMYSRTGLCQTNGRKTLLFFLINAPFARGIMIDHNGFNQTPWEYKTKWDDPGGNWINTKVHKLFMLFTLYFL